MSASHGWDGKRIVFNCLIVMCFNEKEKPTIQVEQEKFKEKRHRISMPFKLHGRTAFIYVYLLFIYFLLFDFQFISNESFKYVSFFRLLLLPMRSLSFHLVFIALQGFIWILMFRQQIKRNKHIQTHPLKGRESSFQMMCTITMCT